MERLIVYIENLLKWSKQTPSSAQNFFHQAFGAVQFYIVEHDISSDEFKELEAKWNDVYRPQFEEVMYNA